MGDDEILAQQEAIKAEISASQKIVGPKAPLDGLVSQYADNAPFLRGIQDLQKRYSNLRTVIGDGNCFFRAVMFGLFESLLGGQNPEEHQRLIATFEASKDEMVKAGFSEMCIDYFWESVLEELKALGEKTGSDLETDFINESDAYVWYARVLASGFLKVNQDRFLPFIDGEAPGMSVAQWCEKEVEPMGKECEQLQVIALTEALGLRVRIEYLDGNTAEGASLVHHDFPDAHSSSSSSSSGGPIITLLYRPGHYDLLYPSSDN